MPAPINANELRLLTPALHATCMLMFYGGCISMARRDAVVQLNQSDPESDPEGEAPEVIQTLRLQQDVSEWLVCLNMLLSLFVCAVTVTTM